MSKQLTPERVVDIIWLSVALTELFKLLYKLHIICLTNYDSLQRIITEMMVSVKEAQQFETEILYNYAKEVVDGFRFIVINAIGMSTLALTLSGITLIIKAPLIVKVQFITVSFAILTEIYMYSWPADNMKNMTFSIELLSGDLPSHRYGQTLEMQKSVLYMLVHQDPITLSISCIVPELSLHYYCSYLSNAFSVFTALRVVLRTDSI
ncbi:hypothetical protein ANTQUA_LOCUS9602 [Anthophora quadrimaculata]